MIPSIFTTEKGFAYDMSALVGENGDQVSTVSDLSGILTLTATKNIELQYYAQAQGAPLIGVSAPSALNAGQVRNITQVKFKRVG